MASFRRISRCVGVCVRVGGRNGASVRRYGTSAKAEDLSKQVTEAARKDREFLRKFVKNLESEQAEELAKLVKQKSPLSAEDAFLAADRDGDGVVSKHEFRNWFQRTLKFDGSNFKSEVPKPTKKQLWNFALVSAVPFVGFGFMDNFGMILFGEYIDSTLGVAFGLSTMMAAGLGNAVADVVGISFGQTIEALSSKLGLPDPMLTDAQRRLRSCRYARTIGTCVGLGTGCLLGLIPLVILERIRGDAKPEIPAVP